MLQPCFDVINKLLLHYEFNGKIQGLFQYKDTLLPYFHYKDKMVSQLLIMGIFVTGKLVFILKQGPGGHLNINMSSYQYRDPHVKDETVSRLSYL